VETNLLWDVQGAKSSEDWDLKWKWKTPRLLQETYNYSNKEIFLKE